MKKSAVVIIIQLIVIAAIVFGFIRYRTLHQPVPAIQRTQISGDELPVPAGGDSGYFEVGAGGIDSAGNPW